MMQPPRTVEKKSGYRTRFDAKKLEASLRKTAHHIHFDNEKLFTQLFADILRGLGELHRTTVSTQEIRNCVVTVLTKHSMREFSDAYDFTFLALHRSPLKHVEKRNGALAEFHPYKIFKAIMKAFRGARIGDPHEAETLTREVVTKLEHACARRATPPQTREIRNLVAETLRAHKFTQAERIYLLHRYL